MNEDLNFYQYVNDKSILVITTTGTLKRLYCPFPVYYKNTNQNNIVRKIILVDRIELDDGNKIRYVVGNTSELYSVFVICG